MEITTRITAELKEGKALIRITDVIRGDLETGSTNVRAQIDGFINTGVKQSDVYINSRGGDVFEAVEIVHQLKRFDVVTVHVGSLAASAATYITSSFKTVAKPDSKFMIHKPKMVAMGNENEVEASLKLLKDTTVSYCNVYATKTGKTVLEMQKILAKGDVWMTAQEAFKEGYLDMIEENQATPPPLTAHATIANVAELKNQTIEQLLLAMGGKTGWSLEDYLTNDVEAYYVMRDKHPEIAKLIEDTPYPIASFKQPQKISESLNTEAEILAKMGGKSGWTMYDYIKNDMDAFFDMNDKYPVLSEKLKTLRLNSFR